MTDYTKAAVIAVQIQHIAQANRRTTVPRDIIPGAATQQPILAIAVSNPGAPISWCALIIAVPIIQTPLPHIAVHIVKAKGIGWESAHVRCLVSGLYCQLFTINGINGSAVVVCQTSH